MMMPDSRPNRPLQGRGDDRLVNRWGPFYTHSIAKGIDTVSAHIALLSLSPPRG